MVAQFVFPMSAYKRPESKEDIDAMLGKFLVPSGFARSQLAGEQARKAGDAFQSCKLAAGKYSRLEVDLTRNFPFQLKVAQDSAYQNKVPNRFL